MEEDVVSKVLSDSDVAIKTKKLFHDNQLFITFNLVNFQYINTDDFIIKPAINYYY